MIFGDLMAGGNGDGQLGVTSPSDELSSFVADSAEGPTRPPGGAARLRSALVPAPAVSRGVIVDDWLMLRVGVAKVLEDLGVRVVAATEDGGTALSAIRTHQADLLIIGDHANPSPELIQRAFSLFPELRCVVMVAGVGPAGLRRLFDVGIHAMVSRSVDPTELGDVVRRVLAGERVVSPGLLPAVFGTPGQAPPPSGEAEGAGAVPPFAAPPLTPK